MALFNSGVDLMATLVTVIGAGLGAWLFSLVSFVYVMSFHD